MQRKRYYRVGEISERTGLPASTLYDAIKRGEVEALKLGAAVYVPREQALRLIGEEPEDQNAAAVGQLGNTSCLD
jgi:excisionase family DNA binding protein